jgi:hypothetical protein
VKSKLKRIPIEDVGWIGRSWVSTADRDDSPGGKVRNDLAIEFCDSERGAADHDGECEQICLKWDSHEPGGCYPPARVLPT